MIETYAAWADRCSATLKATAKPGRVRLLLLLASGPRTFDQVAEVLGVGPETSFNELRSLVVAGTLRADPPAPGRPSVYHLTPLGRAVVDLLHAVRLNPAAPEGVPA